jgi:tetratricopeptide (TPR) repeat protein/tRNA A-37 threonylcarbamoyl transferase component Bud32
MYDTPEQASEYWARYFKSGTTSLMSNKLDEAEKDLKVAVGIAEKNFSKDLRFAQSLHALALTYFKRNDFDFAEVTYTKAVNVAEQVCQPNDPQLLTYLNGLALCFLTNKKYLRAEPLYQRALKLSESSRGKSTVEVAAILRNLGVIYERLQRLDEAKQVYERLAGLYDETNLADSKTIRIKLDNLSGELNRPIGRPSLPPSQRPAAPKTVGAPAPPAQKSVGGKPSIQPAQKPAAPRPVAPAAQKPVAPPAQKPVAPAAQKPVAPPAQKPVAPAAQNQTTAETKMMSLDELTAFANNADDEVEHVSSTESAWPEERKLREQKSQTGSSATAKKGIWNTFKDLVGSGEKLTAPSPKPEFKPVNPEAKAGKVSSGSTGSRQAAPATRDSKGDSASSAGSASSSAGALQGVSEHEREKLVGATIDNRYKIDAYVGAGGMSVVYKGTHLMMARTVAIKMMHSHLAQQPDVLQRFQQEARAASSLAHPNIVPAHDFGMTSDGLLYLVMDYVEGETLEEIIKQIKQIPPQRAVEILKQVCSGLHYAHENGLMHRDLKPSNIMLVQTANKSEVVKIVDFGLAKSMAGEAGSMKLTRTGEFVGSPLYMSPEQFRNHPIDRRSDIYSLGLVAYEVLTGKTAITGDTYGEVIVQHFSETPPSFAIARPDLTLPKALESAIFKAFEKEPAKRYASAEEFGAALEASMR